MEELEQDPMDVAAVAQQYMEKIRPEVGLPLRRRLRHVFSRGSVAKRSFRYRVKPRVYTIC